MGYKQLRDANWKVSAEGGWCLKYVQDAFGTDHPYSSAIDAWNNNYGNGNHTSLPPVGKTVPVYFSLGNVWQGHVAISLDDGEVASSTKAGVQPQGYIHPNLNDLIAVYGKYNGGCTYLGWSEYVGTVHVVEWENLNASIDQIKQAFLDILERPADADALAHYQNYTNDFMRADLANSAEYHTKEGNKAAAAQAIKDAATRDDAARAAAAAITAKAAADAIEAARIAEVARLKAIADKEAADKALAEANIPKDSPLDVENNGILKQILAILNGLVQKITNIFK